MRVIVPTPSPPNGHRAASRYGDLVIPLRDDNPTRRSAVVTLALVTFTTLVWLLVQPHGRAPVVDLGRTSPSLDFGTSAAGRDLAFNLAWAAVPCEVSERRPLTNGEVVATFERGDDRACRRGDPSPTAATETFPPKSVPQSLLVSMFLHGGLLHLAGNMLFLWIFGNNIEDSFGRFAYTAFYVAAGLVATLAHVLVAPDSTVPVVGASGAIAAIMGAYLVLYPRARVTTLIAVIVIPFVARVRAVWLLGFWFVSQFFLAPDSGVAWVAHVSGFAFGALVGLLVTVRRRPRPRG